MLRLGGVGAGFEWSPPPASALPVILHARAAAGGDEPGGLAVHEDAVGPTAAVRRQLPLRQRAAPIVVRAGWSGTAGGLHAARLVHLAGARTGLAPVGDSGGARAAGSPNSPGADPR